MISDFTRPSVLGATYIFAVVLIAGLLWRMAAAYFSDSELGQAMAVLY